MSRKSNQERIIDANNERRRQKNTQSVKPVSPKPVTTKIFKEDWRVIFQCLSVGIDEVIQQETLTEQDRHWVRRRISLCEKILPKFLSTEAGKYKKIISNFDNIIDTL